MDVPPSHSPAGSDAHRELGSASRPSSRSRSLAIGAGIAAVALGIAVFAFSHGSKKSSRNEVHRDVPHLEGSTIVFSAAYRERAGVSFTKAERAPFKPTVRVVGTVTFNPTYVAAIGTRLRGTVRRTFKYEGDHVGANEPLAEIESAELGEAQATIAQAQATQTAAEIHSRREKDLLDRGLTTARESEMANTELVTTSASLRAAEQRVKAFGGNGSFGVFILRSPLGGHVVERHLAPGQSVEGNAVGYKVADLDHLWVELSVFERDLASVHTGDTVEITPLAQPAQKIAGRVAHVGEVIHPVTRSTEVRVAVDRPEHHLRVGQSVQATITSSASERDALLVPHAAVLYVDGKPTVFIGEGETRARSAAVRLGGTDGAHYEILDGVKPGDLVAASGVFALKSELFR